MYIFIKIVLLTVTAAVYVVSIISPVSREYMLSQPASQHFSSLPFERNYYIHGATESELSILSTNWFHKVYSQTTFVLRQNYFVSKLPVLRWCVVSTCLHLFRWHSESNRTKIHRVWKTAQQQPPPSWLPFAKYLIIIIIVNLHSAAVIQSLSHYSVAWILITINKQTRIA